MKATGLFLFSTNLHQNVFELTLFLCYSFGMLGYVKIDKGELKVREYEVYCGYYCGICKSIGRRYGQLPRMALSYDAASGDPAGLH